jgi:hypothetical protein
MQAPTPGRAGDVMQASLLARGAYDMQFGQASIELPEFEMAWYWHECVDHLIDDQRTSPNHMRHFRRELSI